MIRSESSRSKSIDINKMVTSMTREINAFWSKYDPDDGGTNLCPIYRVPKHIFEIDRVAYEPMIISFGPYHHGAQHLEAMEKRKWEYLDRILKLNCERTLHDYIKAIAGLEKQTRKCYSRETDIERKKFLQMLLLDGCFILINIDENVGIRISNAIVSEQNSTQDVIHGNLVGEAEIKSRQLGGEVGQSKRWEHGGEMELIKVEADGERWKNIEVECVNNIPNRENSKSVGDWLASLAWHDIFLLENQIPFFIVERIFQLVAGQRTGVESLRSKTAEFVEDILSHYPIAIQEIDRPKQFHHLLHLCHMYFRPSQKINKINDELRYQPKSTFVPHLLCFGYKYFAVGHKPVDVNKKLEQTDLEAGNFRNRWRQAVQYHNAGVRFKRREYDGEIRYSLLDIRFMDGVIEIPCLAIDESSESLFKNLLALEQIDPRFGNDVSAYITFMSQLVTTVDDATLLVQRGIIVHMMDSDDEVAALFTRLTKQVTFRFDCKYYLKSLCHLLEVHYQSRLNRWIAWLWLNHFGNPWLALAALAAVVVLACTIVQTIYTVLAYVKPPSDT